jgi:hypothetical protein
MESPRPDSTMQCWCHLGSHGSKERCPCSCGHAHQDGLNPIYYLSPLFVFPITYTRSTPFLYIYEQQQGQELWTPSRIGASYPPRTPSIRIREGAGAGDEITSGPRARGQEKSGELRSRGRAGISRGAGEPQRRRRAARRSRPRSAEYRRMAIGSAPLSLSLSLL